MSELRGKRWLESSQWMKPAHRLYRYILDIAIMFDGIGIAAIHVLGLDPLREGETSVFPCNQGNTRVLFPAGPMFVAALKSQPIGGLSVLFEDSKPSTQLAHTTVEFSTVCARFISVVFISLFENHRPWIRGKFGGDMEVWPEIFRFAWVVRNAAAHHDGMLNFTDEKRRPVVWHGLTYHPGQSKTKVIGGNLNLGDMIVLMFEMSDELDRLGCPAEP